MDLKKIMILEFVLPLVFGIICLLLAIFTPYMLIPGFALIAISIIMGINNKKFLRDEETFKHYKNSYYDERNNYIDMKCCTVTYIFSMIVETIALCISACFNKIDYVNIFGYLMLLQNAVFWIARYIYKKKY